jgi:cation/acetate symporter
VQDTAGFYVAGQGVSAVGNGMATAADWMSAASFISMAGLIAFMGYDGTIYLMGWTGGYVLLALLLAPFLRKFGKYTVPDFVGDRYYSNTARVVAVIAAIWVSFTYVAARCGASGWCSAASSRSRSSSGVLIGMVIVAVLRRARRDEGRDVHADRPVLRADLRVPGAGHRDRRFC